MIAQQQWEFISQGKNEANYIKQTAAVHDTHFQYLIGCQNTGCCSREILSLLTICIISLHIIEHSG